MYLRKGDNAFASGDYETALEHYEAAAKADPKSQEAADKVQLAKEKIVEEHAAVAQEAMSNGDLLGAMVAARKAWDKLPDATPTKQLIQDVSNATFARAQELANAKDFANALMLYETLGETLPSEVEKTVPHAGDIKARWGAELERRATEAQAAGRNGDALLNWAKLTALTGDPGHGGKRDELRNQILADWSYWVQLSGRGGEAYENVVAGLSGASPSSSLRVAEKLPSGVKPHARAQLKYGRPKFKTSTTTRTETAQYQSGTQQVPNPFYQSKQDRVLDEERRLVDRENEVTKLENDVTRYEEQVAKEGDTPGTSTGAEQNLSRARTSSPRDAEFRTSETPYSVPGKSLPTRRGPPKSPSLVTIPTRSRRTRCPVSSRSKERSRTLMIVRGSSSTTRRASPRATTATPHRTSRTWPRTASPCRAKQNSWHRCIPRPLTRPGPLSRRASTAGARHSSHEQ